MSAEMKLSFCDWVTCSLQLPIQSEKWTMINIVSAGILLFRSWLTMSHIWQAYFKWSHHFGHTIGCSFNLVYYWSSQALFVFGGVDSSVCGADGDCDCHVCRFTEKEAQSVLMTFLVIWLNYSFSDDEWMFFLKNEYFL